MWLINCAFFSQKNFDTSRLSYTESTNIPFTHTVISPMRATTIAEPVIFSFYT
jgi:hypothetical protein